MKKTFIVILCGLVSWAQSFSQTAEQEAIKKVCLAETQAYNDFDFDAWASYHVQTAEEQLAWNNADGTFGSESGWEAISKGLKDYFKTGQKQQLKISADNFTFVIHGDMAFAAYNRNSQDAQGKSTLVKEYRTLLKIKGKWKILAVQAYVNRNPGT